MDSLATWLASITWPLVSRVLVALGIGYLSYTGAGEALGAALQHAKSAFGGLPGDIAMIVAKFGFFDFMAITSGGFVSGLAWMQLKKLAVQVNPS
ncbi:DUF2523 domain-containing protein [Caldimonas sp. KR1-144]|uniref:DUF2523 domain-containing protein n=1 Tax=Caldimonas sp. KR1-144 TaxID=3400911 RepID=UPI003C0B40F3